MIVKVQLSLESNLPGHTVGSRMLVYNKSRSVMFERDADDCIVKKMKGRPEAFFNATTDDGGKDTGKISISDEAPWQDW